MSFDLLRELHRPATTKTVLVVLDGLGGLPGPAGLTELEAAPTPNLDDLARRGICGLHEPVAPGVTPGSGAAHLALFGYDPIRYHVGRGLLSALGVAFPLEPGDVAARGNFATVDDEGVVTDRRAGRISTAEATKLAELLDGMELSGVKAFVRPEMGYRFLLVLRGAQLSGEVSDTDPQRVGVAPLEPHAARPAAERTAEIVRSFVAEARRRLAGRDKANMVLLRGFSTRPSWPSFPEVFGVRAAAVAAYPAYRGVGRLLGMDALETADSVAAEIDVIRRHWQEYDFFYMHVKGSDSAGEDGDFERKAAVIADVDGHLPALLDLGPDVVVVTGDHSTPATLRSHSWHPVPVVIWSSTCRPDPVREFGERACLAGALGPRFPATGIMPLALAHASRFGKYGA